MSTKTLIEHMNTMLADTYVVLMKTQNVHWNYVGSNFYGMHKMTEEQYLDMFEAVDKIAERIRAKGHNAPSGLAEYTSLSSMPGSEDTTLLNGNAMCQHLIDANQTLCKVLYETHEIAEQEKDSATADLIDERITQHESFIWMLSASISGTD